MTDPLTQALAFQSRLTDTVTGGPITDKTTLVALHQPAPFSLTDSLCRKACPSKQCRMVIAGELFPPSQFHSQTAHPYDCTVTFCELLTAPRLMVEFTWPGLVNLTMAVKVRLTDTNTRLIEKVVRDDSVADELIVSTGMTSALTSHPLSSEGLNRASKRIDSMGPDGARLLEVVRTLFAGQAPDTEGDTDFVAARLPLFAATSPPKTSIGVRFRQTLANEPGISQTLPFVIGPHKLLSLSRPDYYHNFPLTVDRGPQETMSRGPHPMTPQSSGNTFNSIQDMQVQLFETARVSHVEAKLGVAQWAKVEHDVIPFQLGPLVIMAVMFKKHTPLRGPNGVEVPFRLPESMVVEMNSDSAGIACTAKLCAPMPILEGFDALFSVSYPSKELRAIAQDIHTVNLRSILMSFAAQVSEFTLRSQLGTATSLTAEDVKSWLPLLINQSPTLETVDLATKRAEDFTGEINHQQIQEAWDMMMSWRHWNPEQLAALHSVRSAVGSVVLITGPAGTGKTLVQQIIAAFFFLVGFHVLVLAPANSNVADFVAKLHQNFPDGNVQALRILPTSAEIKLKDVAGQTESQAPSSTQDIPVADAHVFEFEMVRAQIQAAGEKYDNGRDASLGAQVLKTARNKSLIGKHLAMLYTGPRKEKVDMWKKLLEYIEQCERDDFDWNDKIAVDHYDQCYRACKKYYIARHRFLVTTTGNVYNSDIQDFWAQDLYNVPCQGVVVIVDEACKDNEIDTLGALMCRGFRHKVVGLVMVGDNRQLKPTDTAARGQVIFSPFPQRKSLPLLSRLKDEGHPCVEMLEQHRMSASIAEWPFANFYPPGMRSSASTYRLLREKQPGLQQCLTKALGEDPCRLATMYNPQEQDTYLRTHYIELNGTRLKRNLSTVVREHIVAFFNQIFPAFQAYYRSNLHENVTIIVAYKEARYSWQQAIKHMMKRFGAPMSHLPKVITIDSSQGTEAPVTIIDCSVQQFLRDADIGFVDDDCRINVAMTRAQDVRWVLGGSCSAGKRSPRQKKLPAYVRYRDYTSRRDSLTILNNDVLPGGDGNAWLEKLERRVVALDRTFADDKARRVGH